MGLTLYLGIERRNIACHKSEVRFGTLLREGRLASRAFRDEAFWCSILEGSKSVSTRSGEDIQFKLRNEKPSNEGSVECKWTKSTTCSTTMIPPPISAPTRHAQRFFPFIESDRHPPFSTADHHYRHRRRIAIIISHKIVKRSANPNSFVAIVGVIDQELSLDGFSSHPPRFLRKNTALEALMHNATVATNESRVPDILNSVRIMPKLLCNITCQLSIDEYNLVFKMSQFRTVVTIYTKQFL
ncbi:hypothetical protein L1987_38702 [Smallanthus sonchifolius]|uniref:Uncharacterized protein n=1 Tax=Smallanthus sonchifolius TaxID=185202 RepID=A0ACB9HKP2_9ASTR|nr:hypothetical protein L1987_38702 [Smallanthus sonchifolius]